MSLLQRAGDGVKRVVPALLFDLFGLIGVGLFSYGAWLAWQPAGFIVGGALLMAAALFVARRLP